MTLEELKEKIEALEMAQTTMFSLLIKESINPESILNDAKKIVELSKNEDNSLKLLANSNILSIVEVAEDLLNDNDD